MKNLSVFVEEDKALITKFTRLMAMDQRYLQRVPWKRHERALIGLPFGYLYKLG